MPEPAPSKPVDDFEEFAQRLSNWGRWGPEDELGTVNFITAEKTVEAAGLVRRGLVTELGVPVDRNGPQEGDARRFNPIHLMNALPRDDLRPGGAGIADDVLVLPLQAGTQWDALAHIAYNGQLYNGRSAESVTIHGAASNSIQAISGRIATRGVLVDLPRYFALESLPPSYAISAQDLEGALGAVGLDVGEGDVLLVRTGYMGRCRPLAWEGYRETCPGLGIETAEWIHARRLAAIASDTVAVEVTPSQVPGVFIPFHIVAIVHMGLLLGEVFALDVLADECAEDGIYEFLFVAPPLPVTGGVGSPINPYAMR